MYFLCSNNVVIMIRIWQYYFIDWHSRSQIGGVTQISA